MDLLFYKGEVGKPNLPLAEFEKYCDEFSQDNPLVQYSTEEIFKAFSKAFSLIAKKDHPLYNKMRNLGLSYFLMFIHSSNLRKIYLEATGIDDFDGESLLLKIGARTLLFKPHGLVGHWVAGNVAILGMLSLVLALITRNISIIKLPQDGEDYIADFLRTFQDKKMGELRRVGHALASACLLTRFSSDEDKYHSVMASYCDVRIAWGGRQAILGVRNLCPQKEEFEFLGFGPKISGAILDFENVESDQTYELLAKDVILFKQLACTSIHWIFILNDSKNEAYHKIHKALLNVSQNPLVNLFQPSDVGEALCNRARLMFKGFHLDFSLDPRVTIIKDGLQSQFVGYGSNTVGIKHLGSVEGIIQYLPKKVQSLSHNLRGEDLETLKKVAAKSEVVRMPTVGHSHDFELPWDGVNVIDRLLKKVVIS